MSIKTLTEQISNKIPRIGNWQRKFIINLFSLWFSIRGRHNYTNLARYGQYGEDTYRHNAGRSFPFLTFNQHLVEQFLSKDCLLAFDPTYISKSGKHTAGVGYFYSGCAGREKWGLEFSGIAAVDLQDKTALHLEAIQTFYPDEMGALEYYADHIVSRAAELQKISSLVAADAFFSRAPFVEALLKAGFHLVTRLRKDAFMRYLYHGPKRKGRGRPKQYDGQIDPKNLREDQFSACAKAEDDSWIAYEAVVNIRAWKRSVRIVIEHTLDENGDIKSYKIYACTDTSITGGEIKHAYNSRFQIEFLYRDAKQEAGIEHCQARSPEKLYFQVNTALTCVSLAKAAYHLTLPEEQRKAFSIADIKTRYVNELFFNRIIDWCGINPNLKIINIIRNKAKAFDKRAA